ncbi:hypothetical protein GCM10011409_17060 [Lentibacillus populi]|uniref:Uncharacterized protein n=1 Tax=Lentibacillus populi TaxID=1827502 RepID=A0A9W5X5K7_9BACI|nr:hypothetical protein GCM10011409_17060 [Lentibacillus populi]
MANAKFSNKIVVYDDKGKTKIGMPRPTALMQMTENESIVELAQDIEKRLIASIDKVI